MKHMKRVSANVNLINDGYWDWFIRTDEPPYEITGKYLFFSPDRDKLVEMAVEEIETNGFNHAKTNMEGKNKGPDYVLCLYYSDDSRKEELAEKYKARPGIRYRYWKSDEDTLKGKYSGKFLDQLSEKDRKYFTQPKV